MTYWNFGSVFTMFHNLGEPNIYKDAPCADGTSDFAMQFRRSLWKMFYEQEIITILKRNNNGKRQEEIMILM